MAITLITGKPGSFKTAYVMETALKLISEGSDCYFCNFRGLSQEFNILDNFADWEKLPDGSKIFIDEIQEFTRDVKTNAKTEELPPHFTSLEKHRHRGMDFYIVTQHPLFIHTHIRRLVDEHRHFVRTKGVPFATQRIWQHVCDKPEDYREASLQSGCQTVTFKPNKRVFSHYESTVVDTHSTFKLPPKLKIVGTLCAIGLLAFGLLTYKVYNSMSSKLDTNPTEQINHVQPVQSNSLPEVKPEVLSSINSPVLDSSNDYNPDLPFQNRVYSYPKFSDVPQISGCISDDKTCHCFTQQGTKLKVSYSDCKAYLSDRPFDPYLSSRNVSSSDSDRFSNPEDLSSDSERFSNPEVVQSDSDK